MEEKGYIFSWIWGSGVKLNIVYNKSCQSMPELINNSIDTIMTSPPYWGLRDYGVNGQLGLEPTFQLYLDHILEVCAEIKRVLKKTGSFWLNMGDTYSGSGKGYGSIDPKYISQHSVRNEMRPQQFEVTLPSKCLIGIPWRLVLRLIDEQGWIQRNAIIWNKPNHMPSSVKDRCSNSYEFLFHLVKEKKYYYDLDAIREAYTEPLNRWGGDKLVAKGKSEWDAGTGQDRYRDRDMRPNKAGKNPGDVWTIPTQPRPEAHFATFPDKLCEKPVKATCPAEICRKCGKPRVRITETSYRKHRPSAGDDLRSRNEDKLAQARGHGGWQGNNLLAQYETVGWTDCGCNAGFEPGVVLDPFAGRGTVLIMAKKLGRHYVGYELKKEYADMAEGELEKIDPLFAEVE